MEQDLSGECLAEENPQVLSPERLTEQTVLKKRIKNGINNNNSSNNNVYIELSETNDTNNNNTTNNIIDKNNNINNNNINISQTTINRVNISSVTRRTQLRIFVPFVSLKILTPTFFMLKYLRFSFENEDQNYCKYSVCVLSSLIFYCYFLAVFTPPNQTNVDKYFDDKNNNILTIKADNPGNEIQDLNSYQWADCAFCKSKKFIRSSHCRTCNKCILLRDHHCPYIASCVGFKNMQYFLNFLFWADFGLLFYVISFFKFQFSSNVKKKFIIPIYLKIYFYLDFGLSLFLVINLFGIMIKLFINIYNNRTQLENMRTAIVEYYFPICPKCVKSYRGFNIEPEINIYNLGFLENIYYIIGPTPFHFIFPLPKYNNYILDENCPVFKKIKMPERIDLFKFMVKKDINNINILENDESSPLVYIKTCHQFYDGKKIV